MTAASGSLGAATSTSVDMTEGIIARFKTMAIFRPAILIARVISYLTQTLASMALVLGVAPLMGFSPNAGLVDCPAQSAQGTPIGHSGMFAIAWCVGIAAFGLRWALKALARDRTS